jgi:hypothetical protein
MIDILNSIRPNFMYNIFEPVPELVGQINTRIGRFINNNPNIRIFQENNSTSYGENDNIFSFL